MSKKRFSNWSEVFVSSPTRYKIVVLVVIVIGLITLSSDRLFTVQEAPIVPVELPFMPPQVSISSTKLPTLDDLSVYGWEPVGNGIVISEGIVLTNKHVVADLDRLYALKASVPELEITNIWHFEGNRDLALVKTKGRIGKEPITEITTSLLSPKANFSYYDQGQKKVCRTQERIDTYRVATNCRFTPGQSGTPVFDSEYNLVGIVTASNQQKGVITLITQDLLDQWMEDLSLD